MLRTLTPPLPCRCVVSYLYSCRAIPVHELVHGRAKHLSTVSVPYTFGYIHMFACGQHAASPVRVSGKELVGARALLLSAVFSQASCGVRHPRNTNTSHLRCGRRLLAGVRRGRGPAVGHPHPFAGPLACKQAVMVASRRRRDLVDAGPRGKNAVDAQL